MGTGYPTMDNVPTFVNQKSPLLDEVLARLYLSTCPHDGFVPYLIKNAMQCGKHLVMENFLTPFDIAIATVSFGLSNLEEPMCLKPDGTSIYAAFQEAYRHIRCEEYLNYTRRLLELIEDEINKYSVFLIQADHEREWAGFYFTDNQVNDFEYREQICVHMTIRVQDLCSYLGERHAQVIYDALILDDPELFEEGDLLFPVN